MKNMLNLNQEEMNKNWNSRNQRGENLKVLGMDTINRVNFMKILKLLQNEEIKEIERQENEIKKYNQMNYRQVLDGQIKSKVNYPLSIPLEPHLNRYYSLHEGKINNFT